MVMVVSLGLAAMRTRRGFCYPNADTAPAPSSPSTEGQRKHQHQQQPQPQPQPQQQRAQSQRGCPCACGERRRKRRPCCRWEEEDDGGDRWKRSRGTESRPTPAVEEGAARDGTGGAARQDVVGGSDFFEGLPDDIVVSILCRLSSSASAPSDLVNVILTCKRLKCLLLNPLVLSKASAKSLAIGAKNWSDTAHRFLKVCVDAGNLEACYILGMIRFYCLQNRGSGASLMAKAAIGSHAAALYSLAVIQFNGSGGSKNDKDLRAGVALCARAAFLGHVDALRELGHCLQDGYGVRQNVAEGRRFLVQANARELASVLPPAHPPATTGGAPPPWMTAWPQHAHHHRHTPGTGCPLLSDFGCNVPAPEPHPANRFLAEWFGTGGCAAAEDLTGPGPGLRLCSHVSCGRPETRRHEFRRCSVCGAVNYCSRACQALDWKLRHKHQCAPMDRWLQPGGGDDAGGLAPAGGDFREAPQDGPPID